MNRDFQAQHDKDDMGEFLSAQVAVPSQRTCAVTVGGAHGSGTRSVVDLEPF